MEIRAGSGAPSAYRDVGNSRDVSLGSELEFSCESCSYLSDCSCDDDGDGDEETRHVLSVALAKRTPAQPGYHVSIIS